MKKEEIKSKENLNRIIKCCLYLTVIMFFACKKDIKEIPKKEYLNFSKLEVNFPDTIIVNKDYKGFVIYKSLFDTLNLEKGENRFINLYLIGSKKRTEFSDVTKIPHDTFGMYKDTIRFKINFQQIGNNYLNGHIEDEVYIDDNPKGKTRNIIKVSPFHKPIFVKDK